MQRDSYIIGGGISGLVWAFYTGWPIITPQIGGNYTRTYMTWLHDSPETRQLLKDVGYENPGFYAKKSYMGYYRDGIIYDYMTEETNRQTILRKMTEWNKDVDPNFELKTKEMSMSVVGGGNNYMNVLNVDLNDLIKRLSEKATLIDGMVIKIGDNWINYKTGDDIKDLVPFNKIVTTIAAPFFWKAYDGELNKEFKCLPITNVIVTKKPEFFDDRYEMIYYDMSVPFSRVSHLGGVYAIEFTGEMTEEQFRQLYPDLPVKDFFIVKQGRIFRNEENVSPSENIIFSGRFAQWEYGITTEHIVKQALDYKKLIEKNNEKE